MSFSMKENFLKLINEKKKTLFFVYLKIFFIKNIVTYFFLKKKKMVKFKIKFYIVYDSFFLIKN